jgi:hypothetical protein
MDPWQDVSEENNPDQVVHTQVLLRFPFDHRYSDEMTLRIQGK